MFFLLLSGGILIGWLLGSKEAVKLVGFSETARSSNLIILSALSGIFILLGAVFKGHYTAETVSRLGQIPSMVTALAIAISIAVSSVSLHKLNIKHSVIQCVIGAVLGWIVFSGHIDNFDMVYKIVVIWIISPLLSGLIAMLLYLFVRWLLRGLKIHLVILDSYLRFVAFISITIAAFYFGANNVGAIMGLYFNSIPEIQLNFDIIQISGVQLTFAIGSIGLLAGLLTKQFLNLKKHWKPHYSYMPETTIIIILSQAILFYLFTYPGFSHFLHHIGLFAIPAVPLSIYHLSKGSMLGIGMIKGSNDIKFQPIIKAFVGLIVVLIFSAIITISFLFITKNSPGISQLFNSQNTLVNSLGVNKILIHDINGINIIWLLVLIISTILITTVAYHYNKQRKQWMTTKMRLSFERKEYDAAIQALTEANLKAITVENSYLSNKLEFQHQELISYALNIVEQQEFLTKTHDKLKDILSVKDTYDLHKKINELLFIIKQRINATDQVESFYTQIEQINKNFNKRLIEKYPELSEKEQRLVKLLKLGFNSKEIAPLLGISPKSVEIARYRLRKKFGLKERENLVEFVSTI